MADRITVNGQEVDSIDQAPAELRALYEQGMAMLEAAGPNAMDVSQESFTVNGRDYASLDEMPAEVRASFQETMGSLDNRPSLAPAAAPVAPSSAPGPARPPDPVYVDERDRPQGLGFAKGLVAGLLVAGAALVCYLVWGS